MEQFVHVGKILGLGLQMFLAVFLVAGLKRWRKDLRLTLNMRFVLHGLLAGAVAGALVTALDLELVPSIFIGHRACVLYSFVAGLGVIRVWLRTLGDGYLTEASFSTIALALVFVVYLQGASPELRPEIAVYRDTNGCEYLYRISGNSSLTPRLDPQGDQVCQAFK